MMTLSRTDSLTILAALGFLALHIVGALDAGGWLWSTDATRHAPWAIWVFIPGVVLIAVSAFTPSIRSLCAKAAKVATGPCVAPVLVGAVAVVLPSAHHLLGDGYLLIRELDAEAWERLSRTDRAPLTFWLLVRAYRAMQVVGGSAETVYQVISVVSGLLYGALCPVLAAALTEDRRRRTLISALLLTTGYLQLFAGYVENYAPLYPLGLLLAVFLARSLTRRGPLWPAALTLGIMTALHFSAAFLALGLAYVAYEFSKSNGPRSAVVQASCFPVAAAVILWFIDFDVVAYLSEVRGHALPLLGPPGDHAAYGLISLAHFIDLVNAILLSCPAVLILLCSGSVGRPADPLARMLTGLALGPLLFIAVANPEIGAFRDWDVLSLPALPLTCLAAYAWSGRSPSSRAIVFVVGTAALHTTMWIGLNADAEASRDRYTALMDQSSLSTHGRVYGWETLGSHHRERGDHEAAVQAYRKALDANPSHHRLWLLLGNAYLQTGRIEEAERAYKEAVRLNATSREAYSNLGVISVRKGRYTEAVTYLDRALRLAPDYPEAWMNRGVALANLGRSDDAIQSLRRAIQLDAGYANAYRNLSRLFATLGNQDSARHYLERAIRSERALP